MDLSTEQRRQIYDEERAKLEQTNQLGVRPPKSALKRIIVWAMCALLILIGGGVFAQWQYRLHDVKQKLSEAIGRDRGLTETILKVESDSAKITFAEFFQLCNKSIEGRTDLIVELRGLHPEMDYELKGRLIGYLNAENEFVRTKRDFYTKMMQESSASTLFVQQVQDRPSSPYGWDYYSNRVQQLRLKLFEAGSEVETSSDEFVAIYQKMVKEEIAISQSAKGAGLSFDPIFAKYEAENQKKAKEAKDDIEQLARAMAPHPATKATTTSKAAASN
jgi:hypothetical protein